jgi:enoyl-CoA hydratase
MLELAVRDQVARVTLSNGPANALGPELLRALHAMLDDLELRDDWRVLVIASAMPVFSAGGDLKAMADWLNGPDAGALIGQYATDVQRLYERIERLPQVTVVEIVGAALGGGLELALACDLRAASVDAQIGLPEVGLGLLPGAGGTQRLTRICGEATAKRLILGAEIVDGAEARALGIVQWSWRASEFRERCDALVGRIAALPLEALVRTKACIVAAPQGLLGQGYRKEITEISILAQLPEARMRVNTFLARSRTG